MNEELKKLISPIVKLEFIIGLILILVGIIFNKLIFFISLATGIVVAAINFLVNAYGLEFGVKKEKSIFIILFMYFRIIIIVLIAMLFINTLSTLVAYIAGFLSHFIILSYIWFTKLKGSE